MFQLKEKDNVKYLIITEFEETNLVNHCFSTRIGGVSKGEAGTLNFGFGRKDTRENVLENYKIICKTIDVDYNNLVLTDQVHDTKVYKVTEKDAGKGITRESDIKSIDAFITNVPGIPIVTFHADCIPVFFLVPENKAIGLAHSGWKGTFGNICKNVVDKMKAEYGTNPKDLICGIGPSILQCHFEVDTDLADMFAQKYGGEFIKMYDKPHINLTAIVEKQLKECGVEKVIQSDICTFCNNDIYYSYRGDNHKTGSLISIMALKG